MIDRQTGARRTVHRPTGRGDGVAPLVAKAPRSGGRISLSTAIVGFAAGTVFWHFVGFWDFVGRAVFKDPQAQVWTSEIPAVASDAKLPGKMETRLTNAGQAPPPQTGCVALVRDRHSNLTTPEACPADAAPLQVGNFIRRGDLARVAEAPPPATVEAPLAARGERKDWSAWLTTVIEPTQR
jgi:hypothetical protein